MFHVVCLCIHLIEMRPLRNDDEVGADNQMEKHSLATPVKALWNEWEIHCLILVSFGLQVFLFFIARLRRRSTSRVLSTVLWLAYLLADSVAIFVLGHLAVHASGPRHQLLLFWAPFVLVHLGGQDTITAFSMQDNELWTRHLLGLVSQVAVAAYVVSRSSWPDKRMLAAMVLMFLCGCFKYAERTVALFIASPAFLRRASMDDLGQTIHSVAQGLSRTPVGVLQERFNGMLSVDGRRPSIFGVEYNVAIDILLNDEYTVLAADDLPGLLGELRSSADRCRAYDYVGARLVVCYEIFYTKAVLRAGCILSLDKHCLCSPGSRHGSVLHYLLFLFPSLFLFFPFVCTSTALVLFTVAQKWGQPYGRADVNVSYVLLIGATILEVASLFMSILSFASSEETACSPVTDRIQSAISRVATYIQPAGRTRQNWSEMLAQYSIIKRHTRQGMSFVPQWVGERLNAWDVELLDPSLTHTHITEDLKKFVLDKLLDFGTGQKQDWNFASTRGKLALRRWAADPARPRTPLHNSIDGVDFPTSVLIWHIATDICYYLRDDASTDSNQIKRSRELSNYIMYLVFKCRVMLTSNSQYVHRKAHDEMKKIFADKQSQHDNLGEKEAVKMLFEAKNDERSANTDNANSSSTQPGTHLELLRHTMKALDSPVLCRAREVAQELIGINTEADRWGLIAAVWLEMIYYIAPRCGGAFHYQHLSTGGEFITHVLYLMCLLGPFLPPPGA